MADMSQTSPNEWPTASLHLKAIIDTIKRHRPDPAAAHAACQTIANIGGAASLSPDDIERFDRTIADTLQPPPIQEHLNLMVFAIYWRARMQSTVWNLVQHFVRIGALDLAEALEEPIFLYDKDGQHPRTAGILAACMSCFEYCQDNDNLELEQHDFAGLTQGFSDALLVWLSIVLIRGVNGVDVGRIFEVIEQTGYMGKLIIEPFDEYTHRKSSKFTMIRDSGYSSSGRCPFDIHGWFIPKGGIEKPSIHKSEHNSANEQVTADFSAFEENTKRYFDWSDDFVLLYRVQGS